MEPEEEADDPILEYNFEKDADSGIMTDTGAGNDTADNGALYGNAKVVYDEERGSNVLQLDGSNGGLRTAPDRIL